MCSQAEVYFNTVNILSFGPPAANMAGFAAMFRLTRSAKMGNTGAYKNIQFVLVEDVSNTFLTLHERLCVKMRCY